MNYRQLPMLKFQILLQDLFVSLIFSRLKGRIIYLGSTSQRTITSFMTCKPIKSVSSQTTRQSRSMVDFPKLRTYTLSSKSNWQLSFQLVQPCQSKYYFYSSLVTKPPFTMTSQKIVNFHKIYLINNKIMIPGCSPLPQRQAKYDQIKFLF